MGAIDNGSGVSFREGGIWSFLLLMVPVGIILFLVPATINMVMKHFHLAEGLGGLQMLFFQVGFLLSAITVTRLMQTLAVKALSILGLLLVFVFLLGAAISPWYGLLLFFYVGVGYGNGLLFSLSGIYATHVLRERSSLIQGYMLGLMAVGYIVGPMIAGLVERTGLSWRWAIALPAFVVLPFILPMALAKLKRFTGTEPLSRRSLREAFEYDRKLLASLVVSVFLAAGGYLCIVNWSVAFLENQREMAMGAAHIVLATVGIGVMFGRITSARLAARFPTMLILATASTASMFLAFFAPLPVNGVYDAVLIVLACVFSSGIYPILLGEASRFPASLSPAVYTTMTTSVVLGALLLPFLIGLLQEHVGRVQGMSSIAAIFLLLILVLVYKSAQTSTGDVSAR